MEQTLVQQAGLDFAGIAAAGLRGKNPLAMAHGGWQLLRGWQQSLKLLRRFKPHLVFATGGYVCVPVVLAARSLRIPQLIYLPDIVPGQAITFLSRFVQRVAVTTDTAQAYFRQGKTVVTGYPLRPGFFQRDRREAQARFGLDATLPTVFVTGGSQGALSLNRAIAAGLPALLAQAQVIHISGKRNIDAAEAARAQLPPTLQARYHLFDYLDSEAMVDAFCAADLAVCRAGASTLGELPAAGLPAILVPYPHSGAHQWANARYLADQGAALTLDDSRLADDLVSKILGLLANPAELARLQTAARHLARPEAAAELGRQLIQLSSQE